MNVENMKIENEKAREGLRKWAVKYTGCTILKGRNGKSYPCGTCFIDLLNRIGLRGDKPQYHEKNKKHDRHNEVWRALLQIRDAELKDSWAELLGGDDK